MRMGLLRLMTAVLVSACALGSVAAEIADARFSQSPSFVKAPRIWPTRVFRSDSVCGVIVAETGGEVQRLAKEVKWHFDKMSGLDTEIVLAVPSDRPSVVLRHGGSCGESRFHREGQALIVEGEGHGLSHAVTYLLEAMGCRYLWPGALGKVIPQTRGLSIPDIEYAFTPAYASRNIRTPSYDAAGSELVSKLGFSQEEVIAYGRLRAKAEVDQAGNRDYFAWHGVAKEDDHCEKRQWGHAFTDYYRRFGATHPEYFALQEDGTRRLNLKKHPNRPSLCLSNEGLVRQAAEDVIALFRKEPDLAVASICLPDGGDAQICLCDECRKLDPPEGPPIRVWVRGKKRGFQDYVSLTDRTLSFANRVAELVTAECPGKRLSLYAYSLYTEPPVRVKPHPALVILSVAGEYETVDGRAAVERNLAGWLSFGNEILWRPNTLIGFRLAAPQCVGKRQFDDLENAKANRVSGADVCAASAQWACRPFDVYFAAKGLLNPDRLDFETIADDFCRAGFGSAAQEMREYLGALVEMGDRAAAEPQDPIVTTTGPSIMKGYVKAFDLDRLEEILDRAEAAARGDAQVLKRLAFLRVGIESGRLTTAVGRARMKKGDVAAAQRDFVDFLRRTMMREPLAVAPYWSASSFYEPHLRGFRPEPADVRFAGGSLQAALDAGAGGKVTIAKGVWQVDPGFVRNDTEIVFEEGAELEANPAGFFGKDDCVLTVWEQTNIVIRGGTIRMHRQDYLDKKDGRVRSQWRHGISLRGAVNVRVEDMRFYECGGDGVYVANANRVPSRHIIVRRCFCDRPLRQSMSVIDVEGLLVEDCTFQRALGENPQAGIDFEPNHPWQRLKRIVMRNCRFLDNAKNGIDIYVAHLDDKTEPVDMLFENCTTISNRVGFGLSMNRRYGYPRGRIVVSNCLFKANREQAVNVGQKPAGCLAFEMVDTRLEDSCRDAPNRGDIHLLSRYVWDNPPDDIVFRNVTVVQSRKGPWIVWENPGRGPQPVTNIVGTVTVVDELGATVCHGLGPSADETLFARPKLKPVIPRILDWKAFVPDPFADVTELVPVYARGQMHFAFYADRARRVSFSGGLKDDVWTSWRPTETPGSITLRKLAYRNWNKEVLASVKLPICRESFAFDVPDAGWYLLSLGAGKSGFFLYAADVPVWLSLQSEQRFDPLAPCLELCPRGRE